MTETKAITDRTKADVQTEPMRPVSFLLSSTVCSDSEMQDIILAQHNLFNEMRNASVECV